MDDLTVDPENKHTAKLIQTPKPSNWAYGRLIKRLPYRDKSKEKWENVLQVQLTEQEWKDTNVCAFKCTLETKARMFQYKVIHRFLATNSYLMKVKIKDSDLCDHCETASETIEHLFWECNYAQTIWGELQNWLMPVCNIGEFLNPRNIILGVKTDSHSRLINHLILITKWHFNICIKIPKL
jgi:hypothetical protein